MSTEGATAPTGDAIQTAIEETLYPSETAEETPTDEAPVAEDTEDAVEDSPDTPDSEPEESDASTTGQTAAEFLGIAEDSIVEDADGNVLLAGKVGGKTVMVDPKVLMKNFQLEQHSNAKSMEASERMKALDVERVELRASTDEALKRTAAVMALAEQSLMHEADSVDWANLEISDPGQAALKRTKFTERKAQLQQAEQQLIAGWQQTVQQANAEQQQQHAAYLQDEIAKVAAYDPRWGNAETKDKEAGEMKAFLADTYDFSPAEVDQVMSFKQFRVIQDAKAYRQGKAKAAPKLKKSVPSFQKPGQARSASSAALKETKAKRARLKKTGSAKDLAAVLEDRF
jgi:hypothetical protein